MVLEVSVQGQLAQLIFGLWWGNTSGQWERSLAKRSPYIGQAIEEDRARVPGPLLSVPVNNQNISHQALPLKDHTTPNKPSPGVKLLNATDPNYDTVKTSYFNHNINKQNCIYQSSL